MTDAVDHPAHYGGVDNPYEAIKVIEAWRLGFNLGNTVKYISRAELKLAALEDLKKARWYLDREIANREAAIVTAEEQSWSAVHPDMVGKQPSQPAPVDPNTCTHEWVHRYRKPQECVKCGISKAPPTPCQHTWVGLWGAETCLHCNAEKPQ